MTISIYEGLDFIIMRSGVQVSLSLLNNQPHMEKSVSGFLVFARFTLGFEESVHYSLTEIEEDDKFSAVVNG